MPDIETLKAENDLAAQVEKDLGPPVKRYGCRSYWLCPFHDDHHPSLEVNEDQERWYCPPCDLSGDVITWVEKYHDLDFLAACQHLHTAAAQVSTGSGMKVSATRRTKTPFRTELPNSHWQQAVREAVSDCEAVLWSAKGARARRYLHDRGLSNDTMRHWNLGFCPAAGVYHGIYVERGVTIPWMVRDQVWKMNVRTDGRSKPKYKAVRGSRSAPYGISKLSNKPDCIAVEGEFDTLLLWQELGEFVDVLSLGSATGRLDDRWIAALLPIRRFWIATDRDEQGDAAAEYWMELTGERGERVLPPGGAKDVTEAWQAGADLRAWLHKHLSEHGLRGQVVPSPSLSVEARVDCLLDRGAEMAPADWASEYASLALEAGWSCFGMTWHEWAEDVAQSCNALPNTKPGADTEPSEGGPGWPASGGTSSKQQGGGATDYVSVPTEPCFPFQIAEHREFWKGPGGWTCARCHPPPDKDVETWVLPRGLLPPPPGDPVTGKADRSEADSEARN